MGPLDYSYQGDGSIGPLKGRRAAEVVGRPAIVRESPDYETLVASLDVLVVRPATESVTTAFLYFICRTEAFASHTYAHTTGTTVLHLGKRALPTFSFSLPPADLMHEFDELAAEALKRAQAAEAESLTLAELRDTLLPKLISGEVRVEDPERLLGEAAS